MSSPKECDIEPKLHLCDICDEFFYWNKESRRFGKLEEKDGSDPVKEKVCTDKCFKKSKYFKKEN